MSPSPGQRDSDKPPARVWDAFSSMIALNCPDGRRCGVQRPTSYGVAGRLFASPRLGYAVRAVSVSCPRANTTIKFARVGSLLKTVYALCNKTPDGAYEQNDTGDRAYLAKTKDWCKPCHHCSITP